MLKTEHPGTSSTSHMHHSGGIYNETAGGENGEVDCGDDEDSMHEDSDMGPDEEASSADMDDDDDDETEDDSSGVDAESISDIVLDVNNTRVKYKVVF